MRSNSPPLLAIGTGFIGADKSEDKRGGETGVVGVALGKVIVVGGETEVGRELLQETLQQKERKDEKLTNFGGVLRGNFDEKI